MAQFRHHRGAPLLPLTQDQTTAAMSRLTELLKDHLTHASPQSETATLCLILVKLLLTDNHLAEAGSLSERKRDVNEAFLHYLQLVVDDSHKGGKLNGDDDEGQSSPAINV